MTQLDHEAWLAKRLGEHGAGVFTGLTDPTLRRERFREAITQHGLTEVIAGAREGKPLTYAQVFERLYGESLSGGKRKVSAPPKTATPDQLTLGDPA